MKFLGFVLVVGMVASGFAQGTAVSAAKPTLKVPEFDVVSVKENKTDDGHTGFNSQDAGIEITGAPLVSLLREAYAMYNATNDQVIGLSGWEKTERFDIQGKVAEADIPQLEHLTREQSGEMLRKVLEDRFHLTAHIEMREGPVFDLVVTKRGLKLTATNREVAAAEGSKVSGCKEGCMSSGRRHMEAKGVPAEELAGFLTRRTQRQVIDKTGLTGKYDCSLDWTPNEEHDTDGGAAPDLLTAIQEQWGLKLEPAKGPVKVLVVDHVEQPSAN